MCLLLLSCPQLADHLIVELTRQLVAALIEHIAQSGQNRGDNDHNNLQAHDGARAGRNACFPADESQADAADETGERAGEFHNEGLHGKQDRLVPSAQGVLAVIHHVGQHDRNKDQHKADAVVNHRGGDAHSGDAGGSDDAHNEQQQEAGHRQEASQEERLSAANELGNHGECELSGHLGNTGHASVNGVQSLNANRVAEVVQGKGVGQLIGKIEEQRNAQNDLYKVILKYVQ